MAVENVKLVNKFGNIAGWNSVTVNLLGRDLEGITEVEYDDELEIESVYGAGAMPVGTGDGNYAAKCSMSLLTEEIRALLSALAPGQRIQDLVFSIVVAFDYNGVIYRDIINNCKFKNLGVGVKQNDKMMSYKHTIHCSHITWNKR